MEFSGPDAIDNAIQAGLDLDGSPIPSEMLILYRDVMDKENGVKGVHLMGHKKEQVISEIINESKK